MKASSLTDSTQHEILDSTLNTTRQTMAGQIVSVSQESEEPHFGGLQRAVMQTAMKTARGVPNLKEPSKSKLIGIFYDVKLSGECDNRPQWRMPTLRVEHLTRLVEIARGRFPAEEVGSNGIPEGDIYL